MSSRLHVDHEGTWASTRFGVCGGREPVGRVLKQSISVIQAISKEPAIHSVRQLDKLFVTLGIQSLEDRDPALLVPSGSSYK